MAPPETRSAALAPAKDLSKDERVEEPDLQNKDLEQHEGIQRHSAYLPVGLLLQNSRPTRTALGTPSPLIFITIPKSNKIPTSNKTDGTILISEFSIGQDHPPRFTLSAAAVAAAVVVAVAVAVVVAAAAAAAVSSSSSSPRRLKYRLR